MCLFYLFIYLFIFLLIRNDDPGDRFLFFGPRFKWQLERGADDDYMGSFLPGCLLLLLLLGDGSPQGVAMCHALWRSRPSASLFSFCRASCGADDAG